MVKKQIVYGRVVKSASGKLMPVVTNRSDVMSLMRYADLSNRLGHRPVLATKEEIGAYSVRYTPGYVTLELADPYEARETFALDKEEAMELARKILNYYGMHNYYGR